MRGHAASATAPSQPVCFGKLPAHGDFIRGGPDALVGWLDRWLSAAVDAAASDPHWKPLYDRAPALRFAVLDAASPTAICGHLQASADAAGRRFPFVVGLATTTAAPRERVARAPLVLCRGWRRCRDAARRATESRDAGAARAALQGVGDAALPSAADYDAVCADQAALQTFGGLERQLREAHPAVDLRRTLIGLGVLVEPLSGPGPAPAAGLALPLPAEPLQQALTAAWWTALLADAVAASRRELLLVLPQADGSTVPRLLVGFDGASPTALRACWDPARAAQVFVDLGAPAWAESHAARDAATARLASYLEHGGVSLGLAAASWREAFGSGWR